VMIEENGKCDTGNIKKERKIYPTVLYRITEGVGRTK